MKLKVKFCTRDSVPRCLRETLPPTNHVCRQHFIITPHFFGFHFIHYIRHPHIYTGHRIHMAAPVLNIICRIGCVVRDALCVFIALFPLTNSFSTQHIGASMGGIICDEFVVWCYALALHRRCLILFFARLIWWILFFHSEKCLEIPKMGNVKRKTENV